LQLGSVQIERGLPPRGAVTMELLSQTRATRPAGLVAALRPLWLALVGLAAALAVAATPQLLAELQQVCAGRLCVAGQVHIQQLRPFAALGISLATYGLLSTGLLAASAAAHLAVAAAIIWRRPAEPTAVLGAMALALMGVSGTGYSVIIGELGPGWWWAAFAIDRLAVLLTTLFFTLFPSGRFVPGSARWLAPLVAAADLGLALLFRFGPPLRIGRAVSIAFDLWLAALALAQIYRYRAASSATERQQTKWVVYGVAVGYGGVALVDLGRQLLVLPLFPAPPFPTVLVWNLAFGLAILRARLYAIDGIVGRTLVYGALTVLLVAAYAAVAGSLGALVRVGDGGLASLIAAGAVAVLFAPLHRLLQRGVNRLLYGQRDEPYTVIARLGHRLAGALEPDAVLPTIVGTVRQALRLPYVAILVDHGGRCVAAASSGDPVPHALRLPLRFQGEALGELLLGPRSPDEGWGAADRRLLAALAEQAGTAVHGVRLTLELQQARAHAVSAREEERRRLRRDLHDGLGPTLASLTMQIDTARALMDDDPATSAELLAEAQGQLKATLGSVRQLVYGLRPPALDQLGLAPAIREQAARHAAPHGLTVIVEAPETFPALPAAVEVAAYYIAVEALANVCRHAGATRCSISLRLEGSLRMQVRDDGAGLPEGYRAGVGLQSMRERAAELGGGCVVESPPGGGTLISAWLPLGP
jgi:signal transduction histidine kinase